MKVSASTELVWQLAGQEAMVRQFEKIEPEHFCIALLKFSEIPVEEVEKIAPGAEVARAMSVSWRLRLIESRPNTSLRRLPMASITAGLSRSRRDGIPASSLMALSTSAEAAWRSGEFFPVTMRPSGSWTAAPL